MVIDDSNSATTNGVANFRFLGNDLEIGNIFIPSFTATINKVVFKLSKAGAPTGNLFAKIYSDNAGTPNVSLAQTGNIDVSTLTGSAVDYSFVFNTTLGLTASTSYWLTIGGDYTVSTINYASVYVRTPHYRADLKQYTGSSWITIPGLVNYSLYFIEYCNASTEKFRGSMI